MIVLIQEAVDSISEQLVSIWCYDASLSSWLRYVKDGPQFLNNLTEIGPGFGYWILVTANCKWNCGSEAIVAPASFERRKPPFLLYGTVNSTLNQKSVISLRSGEREISQYTIGSNPSYNNHYVLEIPVDNPYQTGTITDIFLDGITVGKTTLGEG